MLYRKNVSRTLGVLATLILLAGCDNNSDAANLGKVWHEKEGPYEGTWTRRGDTNVFDAVWKNAEGSEIAIGRRADAVIVNRAHVAAVLLQCLEKTPYIRFLELRRAVARPV